MLHVHVKCVGIQVQILSGPASSEGISGVTKRFVSRSKFWRLTYWLSVLQSNIFIRISFVCAATWIMRNVSLQWVWPCVWWAVSICGNFLIWSWSLECVVGFQLVCNRSEYRWAYVSVNVCARAFFFILHISQQIILVSSVAPVQCSEV